jgi:transposase
MNTTTDQTPTLNTDYAAYLAIDWADEKHVYCLQAAGQTKTEHGTLEQKPEIIGPWIAQLRERFGGRTIAVAVEQSRGALLHSLLGYDFLVLYPLHPNTVSHFREAFKSSGAKTDPLDAEQILEILTKHEKLLHPLKPDTQQTRLLARLTEDRRKGVNARTRAVQALEANLKEYFPQAFELCSENFTSGFAVDLLLKWPSLQEFQEAKPSTIRRFYYAHNIRSPEVVEAAVQMAQQAKVLTTDPPIVESGIRLTRMYAGVIQTLNQSIKDYDCRIPQVFNEHPEAKIFDSFPGAGPVLAPRLTGFFGTDRSRFLSAGSVANFTGIGPVSASSGKTKVVYARRACPKFDRQTFHEFARSSIKYCQWAANFVQYYTDQGKGYHTAVRALAFKWIRILYRCWQSRTCYDEAQYMESLRKSGSIFATLHLEKKS